MTTVAVPHELDAPIAWLRRRGCTIAFRESVWWECRIQCQRIAVVGTGEDAIDAFHHAIEQIFPRPLAWELLWETWESDPPRASAQPEIAPPEDPRLDESSDQSDEPDPSTPASDPISASFPTIQHLRVIQEAPAKTFASADEITEALEEVAAIQEEILESEMDIALSTPPLVRGQMNLWICRARSVEERAGDPKVESAVHRIAVSITRYAKLYWPGSVRAMMADTRPQDGLDGFGQIPSAPPTWDRAAILAQRLFDERFPEEFQDRGGWPHTPLLRHSPQDLRELQQKACRCVESLLGSLDAEPVRLDELDDVRPHRSDLVRAARDLRCIRGRAPDPLRWGRTMGRLRWYAARAGAGGSRIPELERALDPRTKVESSWVRYPAQERQKARDAKKKAQTRKRVLAHRPAADAPIDAVVAWLRDAFSAFTNPEIAKLSEDLRDRVRAIDGAEHGLERGERSRLRRLLPHLDKQGLPEVVVGEEDGEDDDEGETRDPPPGPAEILLERVREKTVGRRAVYFNTRRDRYLEKQIAAELDMVIDHRDPDKSGTGDVLSDVGRWDLVLVNTAFISHRKDRNIRDAAKAAGCTYVNVYNGRRLAMLRGLAHAFGIDA